MPTAIEPVAGWATDCRDKYSENHDSGYAGRICMADGNLAWAAVVSDGAGSSLTGLKISALAVQAFVEAVRTSTLAELSGPATRDAWLRAWTKKLHADAVARFKGGMATFCGAVLLPPVGDGADWKLFTLNVGDSQIRMVSGDGRCMGLVPNAPPNNPNVEGVNPVRVVGVAPKGDFCLMDVEEFPLPADGPCWILAGSDGFFSAKRGPEEKTVFSAADLRAVCLDPAVPFHELPAAAIRRSLANAQKIGCAEMMDNATVAMLGFRVPATDLARIAPVAKPGPGPGPGSRPETKPAPGPGSAAEAKPSPGPGSAPEAKPSPGSGNKPKNDPAPAKGPVWRRPAAVAAGAFVAGLVLGAVLSGGSSEKPADAPDETAAVPVPSETAIDEAVPAKGRCARCWRLYEKGELSLSQTWHWSKDCPRP